MAWLSFSSAKLPKVIVPRQISETTRPVLPSLRVFIGSTSLHQPGLGLGEAGGIRQVRALVGRQALPELLVGEAGVGPHARVADPRARALLHDDERGARQV